MNTTAKTLNRRALLAAAGATAALAITSRPLRAQGKDQVLVIGAGLSVQPGVEFGDDFKLPYQPVAALQLSKFIESQPMIFEAHSTVLSGLPGAKEFGVRPFRHS